MREQLALALAVDRVDGLLDEIDGRVLRRDLHRCGRAQQALRQGADLLREGRAEEEVLPSNGKQRQHLSDVADEAHVEHPIGLVEDEDLDRAEVDGALAGMVEQATRRGDDDLGAATQCGHLAAESDAAIDGGRARAAAGVDADRLLDLDGQLAGGGEHQGADAPPIRRPFGQALEHGKDERGRLAGAGLGAGEEIASIEHDRDRLALDGGWFGVSLPRDSAEQVGLKPEHREGQGRKLLTEAHPPSP